MLNQKNLVERTIYGFSSDCIVWVAKILRQIAGWELGHLGFNSQLQSSYLLMMPKAIRNKANKENGAGAAMSTFRNQRIDSEAYSSMMPALILNGQVNWLRHNLKVIHLILQVLVDYNPNQRSRDRESRPVARKLQQVQRFAAGCHQDCQWLWRLIGSGSSPLCAPFLIAYLVGDSWLVELEHQKHVEEHAGSFS